MNAIWIFNHWCLLFPQFFHHLSSMVNQSRLGGRSGGVRVVVAGDRGTGKSSLISAIATESFPEAVPPVLAPTTLPDDLYPDKVPLTVVDTSSRSSLTHHNNFGTIYCIWNFSIIGRNRSFLSWNHWLIKDLDLRLTESVMVQWNFFLKCGCMHSLDWSLFKCACNFYVVDRQG